LLRSRSKTSRANTFRAHTTELEELKEFKEITSRSLLENAGEFCWDSALSSKEIHLSKDGRHAFLHEQNYLFRTMIANKPLMEGVHYWEIIADARTEHELKIGVSTQ
jgi:hypothetical protein